MSSTCTNEIKGYLFLNDTTSLKTLQERSLYSKSLETLLKVLFVLVFVVNVIGNVSICWVIAWKKKLRSPMNYLLINLSLAHLISGANALLYAFVLDTGALTTNQKSRDMLCGFTEGISVYLIGAGTHLLTMCMISLNRFMIIQFPTRQRMRMQKNSVVCFNIFIWLLSTAWVTPSMISFKYEKYIRLCQRNWSRIRYPLAYLVLLLSWSIVIPLTFLILSFAAIAWKRKQKLILHKNNCSPKLRLLRVEILLGLLILTFIATWFPFFTYYGLYLARYFDGCWGEIQTVKWSQICVLISSLNGPLNPLLYAYSTKEYRTVVKAFYKKHVGRARNRVENTQHGGCPQRCCKSSLHVLADVKK